MPASGVLISHSLDLRDTVLGDTWQDFQSVSAVHKDGDLDLMPDHAADLYLKVEDVLWEMAGSGST